ncbi:PREDICTED: small ubiquitin-related modifier 3-like [Camelina sativa]|uniref:Small ubiquitin-related modifier 3-like n=1 Tax=Camelina sativa TaxID=90675 RepID=A0ABM0V102_CAMSA|nr:PREDICTED: small ubiquitin-related modifier 3-like [Camelina sativa]
MSSSQEEDKKPGDQEPQIILKVKSQDGDEVLFKIKKSTRLKKLMYAYCDRRGLKLDAFAFIFDGARIRREDTPHELDMEDGDEIDACRTMSGGLRADQRQWSYMVFDHDRL